MDYLNKENVFVIQEISLKQMHVLAVMHHVLLAKMETFQTNVHHVQMVFQQMESVLVIQQINMLILICV